MPPNRGPRDPPAFSHKTDNIYEQGRVFVADTKSSCAFALDFPASLQSCGETLQYPFLSLPAYVYWDSSQGDLGGLVARWSWQTPVCHTPRCFPGCFHVLIEPRGNQCTSPFFISHSLSTVSETFDWGAVNWGLWVSSPITCHTISFLVFFSSFLQGNQTTTSSGDQLKVWGVNTKPRRECSETGSQPSLETISTVKTRKEKERTKE